MHEQLYLTQPRPAKRARLSVASGPQQQAASQPDLQALHLSSSVAAPAADSFGGGHPGSRLSGGGGGGLQPEAAAVPLPLRSDDAADALRAAFRSPASQRAAQGAAAAAPAAAAALPLPHGHGQATMQLLQHAAGDAGADEPMPDAPASPASPPHADVESQQQQLDKFPAGRPHHIAGVSDAAWALLQRQSPQVKLSRELDKIPPVDTGKRVLCWCKHL